MTTPPLQVAAGFRCTGCSCAAAGVEPADLWGLFVGKVLTLRMTGMQNQLLFQGWWLSRVDAVQGWCWFVTTVTGVAPVTVCVFGWRVRRLSQAVDSCASFRFCTNQVLYAIVEQTAHNFVWRTGGVRLCNRATEVMWYM